MTSSAYDFLYELASDEAIPWQWRGLPPGPQSFHETLWHSTLAQFIPVRSRDGAMMGLVSAYGANLHHGFAYIQLLLDRPFWGQGWPFEGAAAFVNYVFSTWNLRKLYAEVSEDSLSAIASSEGIGFEVEARFKKHLFLRGRYQDQAVIALTRERWLQHRDRVMSVVGLEDHETSVAIVPNDRGQAEVCSQ